MFTFKNMKPGNYVVAGEKPADYHAHDERPVTVEAAEKPVEVTLSLKR